MDTNRPVILTGVASNWRAMSTWSADYLKQIAGDSPVTVRYAEEADFFRWFQTSGELTYLTMPFRNLIETVHDHPAERRYYMTEQALDKLSDDLVADVDFREYQIDLNPPLKPCLFMGRDVSMPLHYHANTEAVLAQLRGRKRVWLYPPDQSHFLYVRPWYGRTPFFSLVDARKPDLNRFPKFKRARAVEFTLDPGDMLFIPVQWWHLTQAIGFQLSLTQFWAADLRRWRFPTPGIRSAAALLARRARGVVG